MDKNLIILGKRIADLRSKRGLTQEKLAEMIGYSTNHIAKLESARTNPSFDLLVSLSKALKLELAELFDFREYKNTNYIKNELQNIVNTGEEQKLHLLYKIYRTLEFI